MIREPKARVVIVGGGLAGMTSAYELAGSGMDVLLLEEGSRLGGKAGADPIGSDYQEHGNHFFPMWYLNTRRLMKELGVLENLVPMTKLHQLKRGRYPHFETLRAPTRLPNLLWNIFASDHLPWSEAALLVYSFLDLACQKDGAPAHGTRLNLDDTSLDGFLSSRAYSSEGVRSGAHAMIVKSIATPAARLSAKTKQTVVRYWLRYRTPMYSVLNTDLQRGLIGPFENALRQRGCRIELQRPVQSFEYTDGAIAGVRTGSGLIGGDYFVSALPSEAVPSVLGAQLLCSAGLENVTRLESVPMGAMTLYLKRPIPGMPPEHVILHESRYALSFIDVSRTWGLSGGSVLTFNIGEPDSLLPLCSDEAAGRIISELRTFVGEIRPEDVDRYHLRLNEETPLLMNSAGSWRFRPAPGGTGVRNLFIAGDYCRSPVNITSMEGAIASGLAAAGAILEKCGLPARKILEPREPPRLLLKSVHATMFPAIFLLGRWKQSRERDRAR